ncbi:hypothetical protein [Methylobacterium sp. GC_Met_2]|uniref:hypothetical protein n=1 Tax=Methylobacterium sp. GC_Met_2 TaxID=2937376 RepID=UPI00226B492C|nr:hypothetical protein [Methylobacterium sp. GC_Met_2]
MKYAILSVALAAVCLSACASSSDKVAATYVSPIQYTSYSCGQIREESARLASRAATAAGVQDQKRKDDQVVTAVGAVVFWPALFFIDGDNAQTAELARLKGEMEAVEQASVQKSCGIQFQRQAKS